MVGSRLPDEWLTGYCNRFSAPFFFIFLAPTPRGPQSPVLARQAGSLPSEPWRTCGVRAFALQGWGRTEYWYRPWGTAYLYSRYLGTSATNAQAWCYPSSCRVANRAGLPKASGSVISPPLVVDGATLVTSRLPGRQVKMPRTQNSLGRIRRTTEVCLHFGEKNSDCILARQDVCQLLWGRSVI